MAYEALYGATVTASYLAGAIPFGYIAVRLKTGKDVRTLGSGNIGATNVSRVLGKAWFIPVFILDFLKGFAPVFWLASWVSDTWKCSTCPHPGVVLAVFCGLASMAGHLWPVFLGFRGGKGVATTAGILFALNWMAALAGLVVWGLVFAASRMVSLASVVAAAAVPFAHHLTIRWMGERWSAPGIITIFLALEAALVIFSHRSNLGRILKGEERKA